MLKWSVAFIGLLALAGCGQDREIRGLPANHPANPQAAELPMAAGSTTLAAAPRTTPVEVMEDQNAHPHHHDMAMPAASAPSGSTQPTSRQAAYTCTMHPEVVSDKPGKCPTCGMKLVPTKG